MEPVNQLACIEIASSLECLGVMFICLRNALMLIENQQVLLLRQKTLFYGFKKSTKSQQL